MAPGLMVVSSRIIDPSKTSDAEYNRFYSEEHLPAVVAFDDYCFTGFALRYKNINSNADLPYLALHTVDDTDIMGPKVING